MIFVTLGTQDKSFDRLLKAIDKAIENGVINEEVIVQAGYTKYKSKNMKILDLVSSDDFEKYIKESRMIITHGGVGSILSGIVNNKVVIAVPRLKKYGEHTNDHQKQIVLEFAKIGYILELNDMDKLDEVLKKANSFKPKKYKSNNKNFVKMIDQYIEEENHISWYNKYKYFILIILIILFFVIIL